MGSIVTYNMFDKPDFPKEKLMNVFNLAGPLKDSPQKLNRGIDYVLQDAIEHFPYDDLAHVAHFDFTGGPRDLLVSP